MAGGPPRLTYDVPLGSKHDVGAVREAPVQEDWNKDQFVQGVGKSWVFCIPGTILLSPDKSSQRALP